MKKFYLTLVLFLVQYCLIAQKENSLSFDLGNGGGSFPSVKKYVQYVYLDNAFPWRKYKLEIEEEILFHEPLDTNGIQGLKSLAGGGASGDPCKEISDYFDETTKYVTTEDPAKKENELKKKLEILRISRDLCSDVTLKSKIDKLLESCRIEIKLPIPLVMIKNSSYTFTVEGIKEKYEYKFKGKTPGRWLMSYGFVFSSKNLEPEQYYTESNGENSFEIKKKNKAELLDLRYTPTIFWSYFLDKNVNYNWNHSVTAGLGFNTSTPVVACGYNLMFRHNIGISIGACFYEQQKLNGKYSEGQIITENLDDDQLYEKNFRPNLFFGINFRLGDNPFESKKSTSEE